MQIIQLDDKARDEFLAQRRLAILSTNGKAGYPVSIPLWFDWDGKVVRMFSLKSAGKVKRLSKDPRASVLVANSPHETARWVAFEGKLTVNAGRALETAERLTARYLGDLSSQPAQAALQLFRAVAPNLVELELVPEKIRTYAELHD